MTHRDLPVLVETAGESRKPSRWRRSGAAFVVGATLLGMGVGTVPASADPTPQDWYKVRMCESTNNYSINTGNGYYGAYQFNLSTWRSVGGSGYPHQASPAVQDAMALRLWRSRGWQPWACARMVSLSNGTAAPTISTRVAPAAPFPKLSATAASRWTARAFRTTLWRTDGAGSSHSRALQAGQASKAGVARFVTLSTERRNKFVLGAFQACLGRRPDGAGLATYSSYLRTGTLSGLYRRLCSSPEAFARVGNNHDRWIAGLYSRLAGLRTTDGTLRYWRNETLHSSRPATVARILGFASFRNRQLNLLYTQILGRPADAAAKRSYSATMLGRGVFTVTERLLLSGEFNRKAGV